MTINKIQKSALDIDTNIIAKDENSNITASMTSLNFVGAGVSSTSNVNGDVTVNISGGSGGGGVIIPKNEGANIDTDIGSINFVGPYVNATSDNAQNITVTFSSDTTAVHLTGNETITGSKTFNNTIFTLGNIIDQPSLRNYKMERIDKGSIGSGTVSFNLVSGNQQRLQVSGDLSITFSNWNNTSKFEEIMIEIINGGSASITWPSVLWIKSDGTTQSTPTRSLQTSGTDWLVFWSRDGGNTIYGKTI